MAAESWSHRLTGITKLQWLDSAAEDTENVGVKHRKGEPIKKKNCRKLLKKQRPIQGHWAAPDADESYSSH